jgi:cobaltochelatase CobT
MAPSPTSSKKKESPAEPFKAALGLCSRAIAGHPDVQVTYAAGKPELDGHSITLPEPSRVPTKKEISVIRGWADSLSLTAAVHDTKLHKKLMPDAGPARAVFESVERARVEAIGSNRMPGMAKNLTAKCEDMFAHGRFSEVKDKAEAPLEEALALIMRERLTGQKPPKNAQALVDVWSEWVDDRAASTLAKMDKLTEDQAAFGRLARDLLRDLELTEEMSEGSEDDGQDENDGNPDGGDQQSEDSERGHL